MKHDLKRACANCPFRSDIPGYLHAERVTEIGTSLLRGGHFACHKTTEDDGDGDRCETSESRQCAGAEAVLDRMGVSTQLSRIAERLGMPVAEIDRETPTFDNFDKMREHHGRATGTWTDEDDEVETCSVVEYGCAAPAGYRVGGGTISGTEAAGYWCFDCAEAVCANCSEELSEGEAAGRKNPEDFRRCLNCVEFARDEEERRAKRSAERQETHA